jgi:hypothetical protein
LHDLPISFREWTGWLGRQDSNLCILREFADSQARAGFEPLHFRIGIR